MCNEEISKEMAKNCKLRKDRFFPNSLLYVMKVCFFISCQDQKFQEQLSAMSMKIRQALDENDQSKMTKLLGLDKLIDGLQKVPNYTMCYILHDSTSRQLMYDTFVTSEHICKQKIEICERHADYFHWLCAKRQHA